MAETRRGDTVHPTGGCTLHGCIGITNRELCVCPHPLEFYSVQHIQLCVLAQSQHTADM